jgi:hypothetical protein
MNTTTSPTCPLFVLRGHRSPIHSLTFHCNPPKQILPQARNRIHTDPAAAASAAISVDHTAAASTSTAVVTPAAPILPTASKRTSGLLLSGDSQGIVHAVSLASMHMQIH